MAVALKEKSSKSQLVEKKLAPNENARRIFVFGIVRTKPIPMLAPWLTVRARSLRVQSLPFLTFASVRDAVSGLFCGLLSSFSGDDFCVCGSEAGFAGRERERVKAAKQRFVTEACLLQSGVTTGRSSARYAGSQDSFDVDETLRARC